MMELTQVIAENIVRLLNENNLTQAELSSYLDISRQTLSNYLKGNSTIDSVRLVKTANFFNVPITALLETHSPSRYPMLLRATPQGHDAIENIEELIFAYLDRFEKLCDQVGKSSRFIPEQHDLMINYNGKRLSINHELRKFPPAKFKIDDQLYSEIYSIADTQRKMLALNESGAIELIKALTSRGINVIFLDFHSSIIFGLSICDSSHGSYIFVNSNSAITIERQLFTVAHEYAHLILHQPLFSYEAAAPMSSQYVDLLDKMADTFAGRLLCPPDLIFPYAKYYSTSNTTLKSIWPITIPLKQKLNVSFQSLLLALSNYGMLSKSVVSEYFRWAKSTNAIKTEPWPLKDDKSLLGLFEKAKEEHIIEILHSQFLVGHIMPEDIMYFLDCDLKKANAVLEKFNNESEFSDTF